ncbi:MAG: hypothetical protein MUC48_23905 [Leptolyngbya sp. Prado105]|jgi:hypothetical protein|nr:hypothetical protein [Leptolyngbya sp. Prado105]
MAQISISNLSDGSALLNDSESFLMDLSDAELQISGGGGKRGSGKSGSGSGKSKKGSGKSSGKGSSGKGGGGYYPCH